jgi:hypothetical protein
MNEMKNIPDVNESWLQAEKMLDRHFRRKRALVWLFALLIPAAIGITTYFALNKNNAKESNVSSVSGNESVPASPQISSVQPSQQTTASSHISANQNKVAIPSGSFSNHSKVNTSAQHQSDPVASVDNNGSRVPSHQRSGARSGSAAAATGVGVAMASGESANSGVTYDHQNNSDSDGPVFNSAPAVNDRSEVFAMNSNYVSRLDQKSNEKEIAGIESLSEARNPADYFSSGVGFMISAYGGFSYVTKTISTTNDWSNYIDQRMHEEENVFKPSFGLALTASVKKFAFSLGAEYADYGEKTNYSPYSLQNKLVENGSWNFFYVAEQDTDTSYITGNQFFTTTTVMRMDSSFNSHVDTILAKQYDEFIAAHNGVNHVSYFEVPVMITYNLIGGRAGAGVSAGLAPGWLTSTSGYYLKKDGRGIESLEEIESFNKFMLNARFGLDLYYRMSARMCLNLRPQVKTNLNSVFDNSYGVDQKYTSYGVLFGASWLLK